MAAVTPEDMMKLQKDNYNTLAETALPLFLMHLQRKGLSPGETMYADSLTRWNYISDATSMAPIIFKVWYDSLESFVWRDELKPLIANGFHPHESTLIEALLKDTGFSYVNDMNTKYKETLSDALTTSFKAAANTMAQLAQKKTAAWGLYKNTTLYHLLGQAVMPFARSGLQIGGGTHIINATQHNHGPSWKMVVEMTMPKKAWVIYPGGQSGNPGSRFYDNFVDDYAQGKYYEAWIMKPNETSDKKIVARIVVNEK